MRCPAATSQHSSSEQSFFIFALIIFFFVWAAADAVHPYRWQQGFALAFRVLSFPVFTFTSSVHFAETYFWQLAVLNSLIWAVFAAWLMRRWTSG